MLSLNILKLLDFEPKIIVMLFLGAKDVASSKNQRNTFKPLLMSYFIIKQK